MSSLSGCDTIDTSQKYPIKFFVRGDEYKLFGLIPHQYQTDGWMLPAPSTPLVPMTLAVACTAEFFTVVRSRLSVGLVGVTLTIILGSVLGTISDTTVELLTTLFSGL